MEFKMIKNNVVFLSFFLISVLFVGQVQAQSWEHLFDRAKYQSVKISPDGEHLAVAMNLGGKRSLAFLSRKNMKYVGGLKLPGVNEVGRFYWANNERVVIKVNQRQAWRKKSLPYGELYAVNIDGSGGEMIYGYRSVKRRVGNSKGTKFKEKERTKGWADIIDMLPEDNKHILISSTPWDNQGDRMASVLKLNIYNGKINKKRITGSPISYATFFTDGKGEIKAVSGINKNSQTQLFTMKNDEWYQVPSSGLGESFSALSINEEGTHLFALDNYKQDLTGLFKLNLTNGNYKNIFTDSKVDITNIEMTTDRNSFYALRVDDGFPAYLLMNQKLEESKVFKGLVATFPNQLVNITSKSDDGKIFIVRVSSDVEAGNFYVFDKSSNQLTSLFSYFPNVKSDQLVYTDPFNFTASDGSSISGYFTQGQSHVEGKIAPLVVLVHGGPHSRDYWRYSKRVQYLALNGYSVLQVNFRGSTGFGFNFEKAGYLHWGTTIQQDIKEAYQWAISSGKAEVEKACIMGASFGAYSAVTSVINYPETYQCAIANAGVYDLKLMYEEGDIPRLAFGKSYLEKAIGTDEKRLKSMSPVYGADKINTPLFLAHGRLDRRAPYEHVVRLKEALDKSNKSYEWFVVDHETHGFFDPENQKKYMKQVVAFLGKHLG